MGSASRFDYKQLSSGPWQILDNTMKTDDKMAITFLIGAILVLVSSVVLFGFVYTALITGAVLIYVSLR